MSSITTDIRQRLGIPTDAKYVVIFDQAAHLDWDWLETFNDYFLRAYNTQGVNGALKSALDLLEKNGQETVGPYYYSMCEMSYLQKFVSYNDADVVSQFKSAGQSFRIVGGGMTSPDNLVCSGEAFIRNYLLGRLWLGQTFPDLLPLKHCWLPDDFGQDPELPIVIQAMGMLSVAFSRIPDLAQPPLQQNGFDFFWQSSDPGSKIYAHWLQGMYNQGAGIENNPVTHQPDPGSVLPNILTYLASNAANNSSLLPPPYSGAPTNYLFVPVDDDFMMPIPGLLSDMECWNKTEKSPYGYKATGVYAVEASFDDFVSLVLDNSSLLQTVPFNGTPYFTGYYTSRPAMKVLHYDAVRWLLAAEVFGLLAARGDLLDPNFWRGLTQNWNDFIPSTHHDYVCGTASDGVYQSEQLPNLQTAHDEAYSAAQAALQSLGSAIQTNRENAVIIANPAGVAYNGIVELSGPGPFPLGVQGIQFSGGQTNNIVQPTSEGGLVFLAAVESLGYTTGYLTESQEAILAILSPATISPGESGQQSYTLHNEFLTVVISGDSNTNWGIHSITDSVGNSLLASESVGNNLIFYQDEGDIYQFGSEAIQPTFEPEIVTFITNDPGSGATVLEQGPVRVRLQTNVSIQGQDSSWKETYTREYILVSGEPFLRMKTTGAAPSAYSVMTAFPLAGEVDTIVHGTACHWTTVQPVAPLAWKLPIFRATHRFLLAQASSQDDPVLAAMYHQDVPAWGFTGANKAQLGQGVLIGCLLRNTPANLNHGAYGTDSDPHTLHYALRTFNGLGDPTTGQPLSEALNYTMPAVASLINPAALNLNSDAVLLESGFLASIASPGVILAAKPGEVAPGTLILRLYQPTNSEQALAVTLGAGQPSQVTAVTALEDPITENAPVVSINENGFTIDVMTALNTVEVTSGPANQDMTRRP